MTSRKPSGVWWKNKGLEEDKVGQEFKGGGGCRGGFRRDRVPALIVRRPNRATQIPVLDAGPRQLASKPVGKGVATTASAVLAAFCITGFLFPGVRTVWAVGDSEKIDRTDLTNTLRTVNSVWDGSGIKLAAARNEMVAFQVIVESDAQGIAALSASLPALTHVTTGSRMDYRAPGADPSNYLGRDIQIFSVNYMQVTKATNADWIYQKGAGAPANPTGWKAVQLVPENARPGRGGLPLTVPASRSQSIWIEIYTGRDRPAGLYRGVVRVTADTAEVSIPVELHVYDFNLPERNTIRPMIYYESEQPLLYQGKNLDAVYHRFAHRNRIELVTAYSIDSATAVAGRFLGADFTEENGYRGPGEGVGNVIIPATFYTPGTAFDERESAWHTADAWINFLNDNFADYLTFVYLPDEPGPSEYGRIINIANNLHSNPGPGKQLPVFITLQFNSSLETVIDYWCVGAGLWSRQYAQRAKNNGQEYWVYNGGRPLAPAIVIDAPAADPRAMMWACFKHDIDLYFYWHSVHWQHNHQMKPGVSRNQNVWANPITFDTGTYYANGDGVLIWPGQDVLHPEQDRGIEGPISSIQLANFRRGIQDHLYLKLAQSLGLDEEVEAALQQVVPKVFSDARGLNGIGFADREAAFETARRQLGESIEASRLLRRRR